MAHSKYGKITTERGAIPPGEPVFLLRAQDSLASAAIRHYAALRAAAGDLAGARQCLEVADAFDRWSPKKLPD